MRRESLAKRQQILRELRHQLKYANSREREDLRRELGFWLSYR